jgi:hypothetical protein
MCSLQGTEKTTGGTPAFRLQLGDFQERPASVVT